MKRLRWYDYLSVNLFWLGLNIRNTAVGTFFTPYLVAGFVAEANRNTALGVINSAGLVIAMLAQPAFGLLSDRNTSRFGRRRPYILVGVLLDLVFLAAIGLSWNYAALLVATLLIQLSANVSHGPLQGLIPDLVPEDQRGRASAIKAVMELLPIVLVGIVVGGLLEDGRLGLAVVLTGAGLLVTMLLTLLLVHERPLEQKPATPFWPPMLRVLGMLAGIAVGAAAGLLGGGAIGGLAYLIARPLAGQDAARAIGIGLGGVLAMIVAIVSGVWAGALTTLGPDARRHASFTWWIVNRLMFLASITSIRSFALFFLMYAFAIGRDQAAGMTGMLINMVGVSTLVAAFSSGWLAERVGRKRLVGVSGLVAAAGAFLLLWTIWVPNMALIYVAGVILGLAAGVFMTANWALGTDLVPRAEAGRYLGISNLAGAGAGMIGTGIGGWVADQMNRYQPGLGYFTIFAGFTLVFVLSTVILVKVHHGRLSEGDIPA